MTHDQVLEDGAGHQWVHRADECSACQLLAQGYIPEHALVERQTSDGTSFWVCTCSLTLLDATAAAEHAPSA